MDRRNWFHFAILWLMGVCIGLLAGSWAENYAHHKKSTGTFIVDVPDDAISHNPDHPSQMEVYISQDTLFLRFSGINPEKRFVISKRLYGKTIHL